MLCTCCVGGALYRWYCLDVVDMVLVYMCYCVHVIQVVLRAYGTMFVHCIFVVS